MSPVSVLLIAGVVAPTSSPPSLRELCIEAKTVVLARPHDPITPLRFRTLAVLRGKAPAELAPAGLAIEMVRCDDEPDVANNRARPIRFSQALLFLDGKGRVLKGGLRQCAEDGRVIGLSAGGVPEVRYGQRWADVVLRVRSDVTAVDQLMARRRIARPAQRVRALLDWVEKRRGELSVIPPERLDDLAPVGWGRLATEALDWCLEGASPEDAWPAVELFAELNGGELPGRTPAFATPGGRAFLVEVAASDRKKTGERARALRLLGRRDILWPDDDARRRGAKEATVQELNTILERLTALLAIKDDAMRAAVLVPVAEVGARNDPRLRAERLVPALETAYRGSSPGAGRNELSLALSRLVSPARWKELTGNPGGVCVTLRDLERGPTSLTFWVALRTPGVAVHEQPTVVLDRMGLIGVPAETKRYPLVPLNLEGSWSSGWDGAVPLAIRLEVGALQPGQTYRLRVEGSVGKGDQRQKWLSEPLRFQMPAAPSPSSPYTRSGRIKR
jgi:hypothetical protein